MSESKDDWSTIDKRYKIIKELSQGGFGQTYIAIDSCRPGKPKCVIKKLNISSQIQNATPSQINEIKQNAQIWFNREAEALEKLGTHDQIPTLLAFFNEDGEHFYLVMKYEEGKVLSDEIKELTVSSDRESYVIQMLQDLLPVLNFVHKQRVIHRDIKPSNLIRRSSDGKIVVIDFGSVKEISWKNSDPDTENMSTISLGTDGYTPDEQANHNAKPASDIYALGMTCIQVLTGRHPRTFDKDTITGEVIWRDFAPNVSNELANLIEKMVRSHFPMRYQNVSEVIQDLDRISFSFSDKGNNSEPISPLKNSLEPTFPLETPLAPTECLKPRSALVPLDATKPILIPSIQLDPTQPIHPKSSSTQTEQVSPRKNLLAILLTGLVITVVASLSTVWYFNQGDKPLSLASCSQNSGDGSSQEVLDLNKGDRLSNIRKARQKILERSEFFVFSTATEIEFNTGINEPVLFGEIKVNQEVNAIKGWRLKAIKDRTGKTTKMTISKLSQVLEKYDRPEVSLAQKACRLITLIVEDPSSNLQKEIGQVDELLLVQYSVNAILANRFYAVGI